MKNKIRYAIAGIYFISEASLAQIATGGLVAHLPFDTNATDVTGNGHNGMVYGAGLTNDRFGNSNSAYYFDGDDDYIDLGSMGGVKTVSMWVKQDMRSGADFYYGHPEFRLFASSSENGRLTLADGLNYVVTPVHMDSYVGQWAHVVGVSDGLQSKIYFNGMNVATSITGELIQEVGNRRVNVGRWPGPIPGATHYLNGSVDDIRIYDRALTEEEVGILYAIPEPATVSIIGFCSVSAWFVRRRFHG